MLETGFVTHSEYQKHIRGEWRTVHDLWPHIRHYMTSYAQPGGFIPGSIPFADATGFLTQDNANLSWNDTLNVLEVYAPTLNTYIGKGVIGAGNATEGRNVYVGYEVGHDATEAAQNTIMGYQAGYKHTSGGQNTLLGYYTGYAITTSQLNTCVGAMAGAALTTGTGQNTLLGVNTGGSMTTGYYNISIGKDSGTTITTGKGNICIGLNAESHDTDANYRIAIGYEALSKENNLCAIGGGNVSYHLAIFHKREFRFYDEGAGSNYVGFEAPDLGGSQIWVLPSADGNAGDVIITSGAGVLSFSPAGAGDVTAAAVMTDHAIVRGDGGAKGVQDTGILVDDNDNMTLPDGASLTLQESIVFAGATTENIISFPGNIAVALSFMEGANPYLTFVTTNGSEAVSLAKTLILSTVINAGVDTDKFLVLDAGDRVDFRTGAELLADIGGVAAATFVGLTDTPANYVGAADKIVKVNATPDELEFGADIEDLDDVDTLVGQAGKYAKVKAGDAGIEWDTPAGGNGAIDYLDNFENASIHWSWRTDNLDGDRTIVEAANKLTIAIVPGTNYNWWDSMNDAPKIFTGIGRPPCEIITKLITVTTNNDTRAGIFVASNPIGVGADYAMLLSRRTVGGVESLQVQRLGTGYTAYGGAPFTTLPIWLKIRITADIRYGNHLRFYFSVNGIDWTELADPAGGYSDLLTSDGFVVGLFAQNWSELAVSAEFDFFKVVPSLGADG